MDKTCCEPIEDPSDRCDIQKPRRGSHESFKHLQEQRPRGLQTSVVSKSSICEQQNSAGGADDRERDDPRTNTDFGWGEALPRHLELRECN